MLFAKKISFGEIWQKRWNNDHVIALSETNPHQSNDKIIPVPF